ncbi:hypothetical protein PtB15_16B354 [Puccinia triticina]|nr:hypothetical protein PtB15_16B354 [Puccinia triticina]
MSNGAGTQEEQLHSQAAGYLALNRPFLGPGYHPNLQFSNPRCSRDRENPTSHYAYINKTLFMDWHFNPPVIPNSQKERANNSDDEEEGSEEKGVQSVADVRFKVSMSSLMPQRLQHHDLSDDLSENLHQTLHRQSPA